MFLEHARPGDARELTALIGVEDFRPAVSGDRIFQRLDRERCNLGNRQSPGQRFAREPIPPRERALTSSVLNYWFAAS